MKQLFHLFLLPMTLLLAGACKEKYVPPFEAPAIGYLVVEGNINNGNSATVITLSRTSTLSGKEKIFEGGAQVLVEAKDNSFVILQEDLPGRYSIDALNLNTLQQYRLHIKTTAGKEYFSEYLEVRPTPAIDSLTWVRNNKGIEISVNSHDDQASTRYYQWDYVETWEFHSPYLHVLDYNTAGTGVVFQNPATMSADLSVITCWNSRASTSLLIGSTAKLSEDRVYLPIASVQQGTKELSVLYSINVRQFAVTKSAYEFFEKMKKNTESTGTIFDPQPSELKGNIQNPADPGEPVIGFANISSPQQKRMYVKNSEVPGWNYRPPCSSQEIDNLPDSVKKAKGNGYLPTSIGKTMGPGVILTFFVTASKQCYDCTLTGTNVKPVFWP